MSELLEKLAIELGIAFVSALGDFYATNSEEEKARMMREAIAAMKNFLAPHNPFYTPSDKEKAAYAANFDSAVNALGADCHAAMLEVLTSDAPVMVRSIVGLFSGAINK